MNAHRGSIIFAAEVPVLGICYGGQIIAKELGGSVEGEVVVRLFRDHYDIPLIHALPSLAALVPREGPDRVPRLSVPR